MTLKLRIVLGLLVLVSFQSWAQSSVGGKVTTESGEALPGVNVLVKGTTLGTVTDANGEYSLNTNGDHSLVFSFIGYKPLELAINGRTVVDAVMIEDITSLDQIVVVGYGTQEKRDITGAVSVVEAKEFESRPNTQFGNLLQGKTAGVQVITPSGKPSAGFSMRIRGTSSLSGSSEPLYVVDGVPSADTRTLNPADIESITVLKDASSTAIYGAQGANGVVLITTKRGKSGEPRFEFNAYTGFSSAWKKLDVLNSEQYRDLMTEFGQNTDWSLYTENTDWQNEIFQNGRSQNYQLSASGKTDRSNYYISAGWIQQKGAVRSSEMDRYNFKVNVEQKMTNWLTVGTNINYSKYHDVDVADNTSVNSGGVILGMLSTPSNIGIFRPNGTYTSNPFQDWENPVAFTDGSDRGYSNNRLLGNLYAEVKVKPELTFRSNLGLDHQTGIYDYFLDAFGTSFGRAKKGIARNNTDFRDFYIFDNTLTYQRDIEDHSFSVLVGSVIQKTEAGSASIEKNGFSSNGIPTTNAGSTIVSAGNSRWEKSNASFISRVTYEYKDRYLLTANWRADASSAFGRNERWGNFPSVSLGWRLSEEAFFQGVEVIDDLKVRAGWGLVGNDLGQYAYIGLVGSGANYTIGDVIQPGTYPSTIQNDDLKWESTEQYNIGIDAAALNGRVSLSFDAYYKNTYDLLMKVRLPRSTGYPEGTQNIGKIQNKGLEFQISSKNLVGNLRWDTDFNITFNRNKVVDVLGQTYPGGGVASRGDVSLSLEGKPLGMFYGYVAGGVDPATGDLYYIDKNGESTFAPTADDRRFIGNPNPDFIYGMTNTLGYKNFNLSIFFQGSQGNDVFNATRVEMEGMTDAKNQSAVVANRWRKPGDITDIPRASWGVTNNSRASTRFVEDGSFLRLKAITLAYNVPAALLSKVHVNGAKLYVTGENLLTFTDYKGFDPEVNAFGSANTVQGIDYGTYPQTRNLIFGLNVSF
ncbi:SusC/RagA family TonB-linked outer membrane protein [Pseudochryseolinea flava]|uniref:TonB-dependent receptor n=1 Tax=Pseudochryseolinea flava TaxID=2059302 RepID=A0A364Y5Y3_9BACT|nr:TonB-dependent receptor [Pseudochryseolinea flava]RAW02406.1 TonB-dependent receptor [Pseudochryseolinea flava]